jgi:hypothetical protein
MHRFTQQFKHLQRLKHLLQFTSLIHVLLLSYVYIHIKFKYLDPHYNQFSAKEHILGLSCSWIWLIPEVQL